MQFCAVTALNFHHRQFQRWPSYIINTTVKLQKLAKQKMHPTNYVNINKNIHRCDSFFVCTRFGPQIHVKCYFLLSWTGSHVNGRESNRKHRIWHTDTRLKWGYRKMQWRWNQSCANSQNLICFALLCFAFLCTALLFLPILVTTFRCESANTFRQHYDCTVECNCNKKY